MRQLHEVASIRFNFQYHEAMPRPQIFVKRSNKYREISGVGTLLEQHVEELQRERLSQGRRSVSDPHVPQLQPHVLRQERDPAVRVTLS